MKYKMELARILAAPYRAHSDWPRLVLGFLYWVRLYASIPRALVTDEEWVHARYASCVHGRTYTHQGIHDGEEGHWLESAMGVAPNSRTEPDVRGYELKKGGKKTTLGDYSATYYIFKDATARVTHAEFFRYFGTYKPEKGRYSWSGACVPKHGAWNAAGQTLVVTASGDIEARYDHARDARATKGGIPAHLRNGEIVVARWDAAVLGAKIEAKFNQKGTLIMRKEKGVYTTPDFVRPFGYADFLRGVRDGTIVFDSGMYEGNARRYSMFRDATGAFMRSLL